MAKQGGISGTAIAAAAAGSILLWSALKGKAWTKTLRELLSGNQPTSVQDHPIDTSGSDTGSTGNTGTPGTGRSVCASEYGGPNDHTGSVGYHGDNLNGKMAYAELMMGTALGHLPYKQKARITYNGKSVIAEKLDIGAGGAGCGGFPRGVDLWWETAKALGFSGLGVVQFEVIN